MTTPVARLGLRNGQTIGLIGGLLLCATPVCADSIDATISCLSSLELGASGAIADQGCPQLQSALTESGWSAALDGQPVGQTAESLRDLLIIVDRYRNAPPADRGLDAALLGSVIDDLQRTPVKIESPSLWDKLSEWFDSAMEALFPGLKERISDWWDSINLAPSMPEGVSKNLKSLVVLAAVLVLAVSLLLLSRRYLQRRNIGVTLFGEQASAPDAGPYAIALDSLPLIERPRHLLRMILYRLSNDSRAFEILTHRQLITAVRFREPAQRTAFKYVVELAEVAAFGRWNADTSEYARLLEAARQINPDILSNRGASA